MTSPHGLFVRGWTRQLGHGLDCAVDTAVLSGTRLALRPGIMAVGATARSQARPARASEVRIARWSFGRADEVVVCELGLDRDLSIYELTITGPWGRRPAVE